MYFSEWRTIQKGMNKKQFEIILEKFLPFAMQFLKLKKLPKIKFVEKSSFAKKIASFGVIVNNYIEIDIKDRHPIDILRTVAHELTHYSQHQRGIKGNGITGSSTENDANKNAGILLRKFGETHSEYFELPSVTEAKKRKKRNELLDIDSDHCPMKLT